MTLQQLKYIVEVSKCSTISKAAKHLDLTQPTISKAIMDLEDELHISILERGNSKTRFTAEGTELLCKARQILEQAHAIENRFLNTAVEKKRFAVSTQHYAFAVKAFIGLVNEEKSENYEFYFREGKTHEIINDVASKRSDIGIIFLSDSTCRYMNRIMETKDIIFSELKSFISHVFVRKNHPLTCFSKVTLQQLEDYTCVAYEPDDNSLNFTEETISVGNVKKVVYVKDRATTNNLIANTDCYNIGTGCLIDGVISEDIISIPIDGYSEKMTVGWIKLKHAEYCEELQGYVEKLKKALTDSYTGIKG